MSESKVLPVILAGGSGTRLWPLSRAHYPKQFLTLNSEHSLFIETLNRVNTALFLPPLIITHEAHRFLVAEQLRAWGHPISGLLLEPERKGTAPAAALAAHYASRYLDQDMTLLILPADHLIPNHDDFQTTILQALDISNQGYLTTLGVTPSRVETGFGYIEMGEQIGPTGYKVKAFTEKPPYDEAKTWVEAGCHLWNSGLFLFHIEWLQSELTRWAPELARIADEVLATIKIDADFIRFDAQLFSQFPDITLDYALMEKTDRAAVTPFIGQWHDVGAWRALDEILPQDASNNILIGDVVTEQVSDCILNSQTRLLAAVGIKGLIVVETSDAVLIMDKHQQQHLKSLIATLKKQERAELVDHVHVHRPWGAYKTIMKAERFQVKQITVKVGAQLSLQLHHHRSEHWVVVKGTARVQRGDEVFLLSENQSTYIPIGTVHRLENIGKIPLELIEVQSGSYLGEDDILRLEDAYGRKDSHSKEIFSEKTSYPTTEIPL